MRPTVIVTSRDPEGTLTRAALSHLVAAQDARLRWESTRLQAVSEYGDTDRYVSGVYAAHFPEAIKDRLRFYAHFIGTEMELAEACWVRAGRMRHTFHEVMRPFRKLPDGRESYY